MSALSRCKVILFAVTVFCAATSIVASAQVFTKMHSFNGADGANPYAGLTQGTDGNFYGTTIDGGANGGGNFFRITRDAQVTSLYDFCSQSNCTDGQYPDTVLALGIDGNFYGTAQSGGTKGGYGTVFKITLGGVLNTLHSFDANDGAAPYGSLVLATNGNFYGTANVGGTNGGGNVFKITPDGTLTTLYTFCSKANCSDGQYPVGPLVQASDGNIYGATHAGGNTSCQNGCGTVFRMSLSGALTTLYRFNGDDGEYPNGGIVEGRDGAFYGTTGGGSSSGGIVFRITRNGAFTTLHSFNFDDGASPYALSLGSDGNFYGTTSGGGSGSRGTVFKITPTGAFTPLHDFVGIDGADLNSALLQATNGLFYGTTYFGGGHNDGTVFALDVGLHPFVAFVRPSGKVGQTGGILGQGFTGTIAVSINGIAANFTVVSDTFITAKIPSGATTGYVTVTTPRGVLKSNVPFFVIP